jgi:hypothetical protein
MKLVLSVLYLCLLFPVNAHAYSDPGSGLMMWQLAASFFVGLLFYFKRFLAIINRFFKNDK